MTRKGHTNSGATSFGTMDDLHYTYDAGNKLKKVLDNGNDTYGFKDGANTTTEYTYDVNGNMLTDANKGISNIAYNHLNLPTVVTINGQQINYTYDAAGTKLRKVVSGVTTDYAGNYIYKNNALQFFNTAEGYYNVTSTSGTIAGKYVYQYKDHLGNIRLSYSDANNNGSIAQSEIIEESNYYPFGLKHKGYNTAYSGGNAAAQKFGFGGKELQDDLVGGSQLNWHDFGARNYDASLARWMNIDPLADKYYGVSPYNYTLNNPVLLVDPDGKDVTITIRDGEIVISSNIYIRGSGANSYSAKNIKRSIEKYWNKGQKYKDGDGNEYSVSVKVNVSVIDDETELKEGDNVIDVIKDSGRSNVDRMRQNGGNWYTRGQGAGASSSDTRQMFAHEFGHLAGLKDRYTDKYIFFGESIPHEGWEDNLMGGGDNIDQRNTDGIVSGAVKKYNKFKRAYSNYKASKNPRKNTNSRGAPSLISILAKRYEKTGTFKYIKKPVLTKVTGN